jgi:hypothetical protein
MWRSIWRVPGQEPRIFCPFRERDVRSLLIG